MSKDTPTTLKHKKGKARRVVAVAQPPAQRAPAAAPQPPVALKPRLPAPPPLRPTQPPDRTAIGRPARPAPRPELAGTQPWSISLEAGLYVLFAVVAFAIRLYALGRFPLQEVEATRAWAAWGLYRGLPDANLAGQSPLPVFAAYLSYLVLGAGDVAARIIPALAGGLLAILPYFLRRDLGRTPSLVAGCLLAISPTFVFASRALDGSTIVAAGALALLASALAYRRDPGNRYVYYAAIALGAMFAADKTAGPTFVILAAFAIVGWLRSGEQHELPVKQLRNGLLVFLGTTVLLGTGFLSNLQGVQGALIDPLTAWFSGASAVSPGAGLAYITRLLIVYEPLVLVTVLLGFLGLVAARLSAGGLTLALPTLRRDGADESNGAVEDSLAVDEEESEEPGAVQSVLRPFLIIWSLAAFIFFALLGDQSPASAVQILLPMTLLAGSFIGDVLETLEVGESAREVWLLAYLFVLIAFSLVPWANPTTLFGGRFTSLEKRIQAVETIVLAVIVLGLAALAARSAYQLRMRKTLVALGLAAGIALGLFTVHTTWQLNQVNQAGATEPILAQRTAPDVLLLLADMRAISRNQGDDAVPVTLDDRVPQPVRWYLRQFTKTTVGRVGAATKTPIIIAPADAKDATAKSLGSGYANQRYRLSSTFTPVAPLINWLRWAHVREQISPLKTTDIVVFYKLPQ